MPIAGLIEGFQARRESEIKRQQDEDALRRQGESKVFEYLLQSNDPEMRALALSGLLESAQPGKRKRGLAGYMGEIQGGQFYPQILARMNEEVPDEPAPQGSVPAVPGGAAMPANQPVRPGSTPIAIPSNPAGLEPTPPPMDLGSELSGQGVSGPGMLGGPPPTPPMAPPVSKFKRRGTGVPTAEEIAEANAAAQLRGRMGATSQALHQIGAPPPMIQRALLGIAGAPPPADRMMAGDTVVLPDGSGPYDTLWVNGVQQLPDGRPVPPGAKVVKTGGGGGLKGVKQQDPGSQTGWSQVFFRPDGTEAYRVEDVPPFVPPPAYGGTTVIPDPDNPTVPQVAPILRGGGTGAPLGDRPDQVPSTVQTDAQALIATVNQRIADARRPGLPVRPGLRDQITAEEARKVGAPYTTWGELERAAKSTPPVTPRQKTEGGSLAERVRQRALENRRLKAGAPPPPR